MISLRFRLFAGTALIAVLGATFPTLAKRRQSDIDNIGTRDINKGSANVFSREREIALGRQLAEEVERKWQVVDDPVISEYINRVGQNIVLNSDARNVPFTIKVIASVEVNAYGLPGGVLFVNTGLILAADSEAELAAVIAHEIAHVAARHRTEQLSKDKRINPAKFPLVFDTESPSALKFVRRSEVEADYLGVQYLYKSGYDPSAMVWILEKLDAKEKSKPGLVPKFVLHPSTTDRISRVREAIKTLPRRTLRIEVPSEFDNVKARTGK